MGHMWGRPGTQLARRPERLLRCQTSCGTEHPLHPPLPLQVWDLIIVGAGVAGAAFAFNQVRWGRGGFRGRKHAGGQGLLPAGVQPCHGWWAADAPAAAQ